MYPKIEKSNFRLLLENQRRYRTLVFTNELASRKDSMSIFFFTLLLSSSSVKTSTFAHPVLEPDITSTKFETLKI